MSWLTKDCLWYISLSVHSDSLSRCFGGAVHETWETEILDVLRPVNREGSYQDETKCNPTTNENSDSLFSTDSTIEDWRNWEKMQLNEPGRQRNQVSRHSMSSYIFHIFRALLHWGKKVVSSHRIESGQIIDTYLMFFFMPVNRKGWNKMCLLPQVKMLIYSYDTFHCLWSEKLGRKWSQWIGKAETK